MGKFLDAALAEKDEEAKISFLNAALDPESVQPDQAQAPEASIGGALSLGVSAVRGVAGEVAGGLMGIGRAVNPFAPEGTAGQVVESVSRAIAGELSPEGQETLKATIDKLPEGLKEGVKRAVFAAVGSVERTAEFAAEEVGPVAGAAVKTLPVAVAELVGFKGASSLLRSSREATKAGTSAIEKGIKASAPSAEELKGASRILFKELDESGVVIRQDSYTKLVSDIEEMAARNGAHPNITPASMTALGELQKVSDRNVLLTELDTLRAVAQNAARSTVPADASIGSQIVDAIDGFFKDISATDITAGRLDPRQISTKFKTARELWGRARRSEMITDALERARNQASGFENGIVSQLRSILNNPKKIKFFTPEEQKLMKRIVRRVSGPNVARLIGLLGVSIERGSGVLGAGVGGAAGFAGAGVTGMIVVPTIGTISRFLGKRMMEGRAEFLDSVIRAGRDGKKITEAYLRHTPKDQRNAAELTQLLKRPDIELPAMPKDPLLAEAVFMAQRLRDVGLVGVGIAAPAIPQNQTLSDPGQPVQRK